MDHDKEAHYAIPASWDTLATLEDDIPPLRIAGTSFKEPGCPNSWCNSEKTIEWFEPGEYGYWIDAMGVRHPFEPQLVEFEEEEEL